MECKGAHGLMGIGSCRIDNLSCKNANLSDDITQVARKDAAYNVRQLQNQIYEWGAILFSHDNC